MALTHLPPDERPRERMIKEGPQVLSVAELIAVILGSGTRGKSVLALAQELLSTFGGIQGLARATIPELAAVRGMGAVKALQLQAAIEIALRRQCEVWRAPPTVKTPQQAYALVRHLLFEQMQEIVVVILRDRKCRPLRVDVIARGGQAAANFEPSDVFRSAVQYRAAGLIMAHNHPSGDLNPSDDDLMVTRKLVSAGRLLEIAFDDHLIVARDLFCSLRTVHAHLWERMAVDTQLASY